LTKNTTSLFKRSAEEATA